MQLLRQIRLLFIIPLFTGCQWFQPTAHFIISNSSRDSKPIDIIVTMGGKTVFNNAIEYTGVQPDLKYSSQLTLPKGKYIIKVSADSGRIIVEQPVDLGNDRWIFISYSLTKPIDSATAKTLLTNFGNDTAWVNSKLRGSPSEVTIHVMDKEPVHK